MLQEVPTDSIGAHFTSEHSLLTYIILTHFSISTLYRLRIGSFLIRFADKTELSTGRMELSMGRIF